MKSLLDKRQSICIEKYCKSCNTREFYPIEYGINNHAVIEHRFIHNESNKSADVALICESGEIEYIFEICYRHKTAEEDRPEPWVEIDAESFIADVNTGSIVDEQGGINIQCIRNHTCELCKNHIEKIKEEKRQMTILRIKEEQRRNLEKVRLRQIHEEKEAERIRLQQIQLDKEAKERHIEIMEQMQLNCELLKMKKECKCNIAIENLYHCDAPNYEIVKLSNNLFCTNCNKWKCRCE